MVYSALLGFVGWSFIPRVATQQALKIILPLYPRFGRAAPSPGTPAFAQLYRYTYSAVVLGYLLYTLINGSNNMAPNFYEILGVSPHVDENGLKLAFRQFAKKFHPDRVGPQGAELFMTTRDAFEALKNPTVRFAYDRFGPDVLQWSKLSTTREYLRHGLLQSVGYHIATAVGLLVFSAVGNHNPVKFWRYILYFVFLASELAYVLYPSPSSLSIFSPAFWDPTNSGASPTLLHILFPQRVAYQHVLFLHQIFLFLSLALTKVAPMLFPDVQRDEQQQVLQQISKLAAFSDVEASIMLHTDLQSIHPATPTTRVSTSHMRPVLQPSTDIIDLLAEELKNMIIEAKVKQDAGPLRSVWERAIVRERTRSEASPSQLVIPGNTDNGHSPSPLSACEGEGKLPSPRPSPPPTFMRQNSSYVRARSVSWS
ncbi:hypothetical protein BT96DRAFT_849361 [Gymnopus androsaceus JB14]|uniref:J domain-containing protein n=1 Tax=Gymnopus androsaceus JB14 TaxID=1447944 RepID=A0A6A4II60_9AGAR|nr:hypothetical protein BT96DRAFT_849361 [Gymnopus androsaceus JB14]